jgi:hypothetical protein
LIVNFSRHLTSHFRGVSKGALPVASASVFVLIFGAGDFAHCDQPFGFITLNAKSFAHFDPAPAATLKRDWQKIWGFLKLKRLLFALFFPTISL